MSDSTVHADIHFLAEDELYEEEKPYSLRYEPEGDYARTNINIEKHEGIEIHDLRGLEFSFEKNGFTVMNLESKMKYEDWDDPEKVVEIYLREVSSSLKKLLGARHVQIFDHLLRKRHPSFPISTGEEYSHDQPTSTAHVDATLDWTKTVVARLNGEKADGFLTHRIQNVNVWKPLRGPLRDWPLGLVDLTTVDPDDLIPADQVYAQYVTENVQVHFNPGQKWYYLKDQLPSELIVFRQNDSQPGSNHGVPHSSFFNPLVSTDDFPRESIECRALIYYGECTHDP